MFYALFLHSVLGVVEIILPEELVAAVQSLDLCMKANLYNSCFFVRWHDGKESDVVGFRKEWFPLGCL